MPESKSGALPLGDIPMLARRPGADTRGIISRHVSFGNLFFMFFGDNLRIINLFLKLSRLTFLVANYIISLSEYHFLEMEVLI